MIISNLVWRSIHFYYKPTILTMLEENIGNTLHMSKVIYISICRSTYLCIDRYVNQFRLIHLNALLLKDIINCLGLQRNFLNKITPSTIIIYHILSPYNWESRNVCFMKWIMIAYLRYTILTTIANEISNIS